MTSKERETISENIFTAKGKLGDNTEQLNKLRIEGGKKGLIFATELSKSYDTSDLAIIRDKVRNAPENIRVLWNLFEGEMKVLDKNHRAGAWYEYNSNHYGIVFDIDEDKFSKLQKPHRIIFHKLEPLIDHAMESRMTFRSVIFKNGLFGDTLRREAEDYINATLLRLKREAIVTGKSTKAINKSIAYKDISSELRGIDIIDCREVSDVWHGATNKKVFGYTGHTQKGYWEDLSNLPKEAFAHMFEATINNPESLAQIKKYFPESYKIFEGMIDDFVKGMG